MEEREYTFRVAYFRNKIHMSARELSLQIGMSENYINKLESYNFSLSIPVLLQILEALGVSVEEFFSDNYQTYRLDKKLDSVFAELKPVQREAVLALIQSFHKQ